MRRRAQTMALFAVLLPVLLGMVGLAIDLALLGAAHLELSSTASQAAAAGADVSVFRDRQTIVDQPGARTAAERYLSGVSLPLASTPVIRTTRTSVSVELTQSYRPHFLGIVGVGEILLRVERVKVPRTIL